MSKHPKVAITQSSIIMGGRLRVIIEIIEILNALGITPDIITTRLSFEPEQIAEKYGKQIQVNYRFIPRIPKLPHEFAIALFNAMLKHYTLDYNLLINTNNSLIFLPKDKKILTYMFYPRKSRIMADAVDIHQPDKTISSWSYMAMRRILQRQLYRLSTPHPDHKIICMTNFTCSALKQVYNIPIQLPIIYPPVDITSFKTSRHNKIRAIVTLGRFSPGKRQLEQIKLAQRLPDIPFHIMGFANNNPYYQQCKNYVKTNNIKNVYLHPDAPFSEVLNLLKSSKYFLHTLVNEPFGITAIQAVAAGCLPIVHNSGGQIETVPEPRLRYQQLDEVPNILDYLNNLNAQTEHSLISHLQTHIATHFDAHIFKTKMQQKLSKLLFNN